MPPACEHRGAGPVGPPRGARPVWWRALRMTRTRRTAQPRRLTCGSHENFAISLVSLACICGHWLLGTIATWLRERNPLRGGVMAIEVERTARTSPTEVLEKARQAG